MAAAAATAAESAAADHPVLRFTNVRVRICDLSSEKRLEAYEGIIDYVFAIRGGGKRQGLSTQLLMNCMFALKGEQSSTLERIPDIIVNKLQELLQTHVLPGFHNLTDSISELVREWRRYLRVLDVLTVTFKFTVKKERPPPPRQINFLQYMTVYQLGCVAWRRAVFEGRWPWVKFALAQLQDERENERPPLEHLPEFASMLHEMGWRVESVGWQYHANRDPDVYNDYAKQVVELSLQHYSTQVARLLAGDFIIYVNSVGKWLMEETARAPRYLNHVPTDNDLDNDQKYKPSISSNDKAVPLHKQYIDSLRSLFTTGQMDHLVIKFAEMLRQGRMDTARSVCELLRGAPVEALVAELRSHVETVVGSDLAEAAAAAAASNGGLEPRVFVDIVDLAYAKYTAAIPSHQTTLLAAIDQALTRVVNNNTCMPKSSSTAISAADLVARALDAAVRSNSADSSNGTQDSAMQRVLRVHRFLQEKDAFIGFYQRMMAKRLVMGSSSSSSSSSSSDFDSDRQAVAMLRGSEGIAYVSKLENMLRDMDVNRDNNFDKLLESALHVKVLTALAWPFHVTMKTLTLPPPMQYLTKVYETVYKAQHSSRVLQWLHHLGRVELATTHTPKRQILVVTTLQAAVLLHFNDAETVSVSSLVDNLGVPEDLLRAHVDVLVMAKILVKAEAELAFTVNDKVKFKETRVRIDSKPIKLQQTQEKAKVEQEIEADRKLVLQAAMVRVMKARKSLEFNQLFTEVMGQIGQRMKIEGREFKGAVEALIEKDYLQRDAASVQLLRYVS